MRVTLVTTINGEQTDICPAEYSDNKLTLLDGLYGIDAYGVDNGFLIEGVTEEDGVITYGDDINTFYDTAVDEILKAIELGAMSGKTSNGVEWEIQE